MNGFRLNSSLSIPSAYVSCLNGRNHRENLRDVIARHRKQEVETHSDAYSQEWRGERRWKKKCPKLRRRRIRWRRKRGGKKKKYSRKFEEILSFFFRHPRAIVICTSMEAQQVYPISRGTRTAGRDCSVNSSESVTRTERLLQYILLIINHLDKESKNLSRLLIFSLSLWRKLYFNFKKAPLWKVWKKM